MHIYIYSFMHIHISMYKEVLAASQPHHRRGRFSITVSIFHQRTKRVNTNGVTAKVLFVDKCIWVLPSNLCTSVCVLSLFVHAHWK